ncbi:MAG: hypothetical protein QOF09_976 [Alphaproteobacteria bacterium]|jgi:hypothetical protein|nr:hypothetical protein [Alphaproteobacteria bacterium]
MKTLKFAGALAIAFALGGITTLLGFPRHTAATNAGMTSAVTISPEELTRSAGPLPEIILEHYH